MEEAIGVVKKKMTNAVMYAQLKRGEEQSP